MKGKLLERVGCEILGWDGMTDGPGMFGSTVYRYGRREIGHIHDDGIADLPFPKNIHDDLISSGRASAHRAGSSGYVSFAVRSAEDVDDVLELFHMNYDRAVESAARRKSA